MKRSIFSGSCNCGQVVQKFPGIPVKARKRKCLERYYLFPKTFHRDEPFHLNSRRNYRKFHSNGKRSWLTPIEFWPNPPRTTKIRNHCEISEPWRQHCELRNHSEPTKPFRHFGSIMKFGIFLRIAGHKE